MRISELGCELGRIAAHKVFGAEIAIACAVAQHVIDDRQDRSSNGDKCFLRPRRALRLKNCAYRFQAMESSRRGANPAQETRCPAVGKERCRRSRCQGARVTPRRSCIAADRVREHGLTHRARGSKSPGASLARLQVSHEAVRLRASVLWMGGMLPSCSL